MRLSRFIAEVRASTGNALQAWFGRSQVVNQRGQPLVVYHGSKSPWVAEFDLSQEGSGVVRSTPMGVIWFSNSKDNASWFSDRQTKRRADPDGVQVYGDADKWYAAICDGEGDIIFSTGPYPNGDQAEQRGQNEMIRYNAKLRTNTFVTACYLRIENPLRLDGVVPRRAEVDAARAGGHDGIIADNVTDGSHHGTVFVIFDPKQAKAVDNIGAFDPGSANLRESFSLSPAEQERIFRSIRDHSDEFNLFAEDYGMRHPTNNPNSRAYQREIMRLFREEIADRIGDVESTIEWLSHEGNGFIEVWRMITVTEKWNPIAYPLGLYWSYEEENAEAHWGDDGEQHALLHARVHLSQIDIATTIMQNAMNSYKREKEIRVRDGGWVDLIDVQIDGSPIRIRPGRYPVGNGDYVGESTSVENG